MSAEIIQLSTKRAPSSFANGVNLASNFYKLSPVIMRATMTGFVAGLNGAQFEALREIVQIEGIYKDKHGTNS